MSDAVAIALITGMTAAVPLILTQIIGFIVSLRRTDQVKDTLKTETADVKETLKVANAEQATKLDEVKTALVATETKTTEKLDHIVGLTNSTATAAREEIARLTEQVRLLLEEKADKEATDKQQK